MIRQITAEQVFFDTLHILRQVIECINRNCCVCVVGGEVEERKKEGRKGRGRGGGKEAKRKGRGQSKRRRGKGRRGVVM